MTVVIGSVTSNESGHYDRTLYQKENAHQPLVENAYITISLLQAKLALMDIFVKELDPDGSKYFREKLRKTTEGPLKDLRCRK